MGRIILHRATFRPEDDVAKIKADVSCPACGHYDPGSAAERIADDYMLRIFCTECGSFFTVVLSPAQTKTIRRQLCPPLAAAVEPVSEEARHQARSHVARGRTKVRR